MGQNAHPLKHEMSPIVTNEQGVDRKQTKIMIDSLNAENPIWGWKSPQDLFTLYSYVSFLRNPHIIVVIRNILDVCLSIQSNENVDIVASINDVTAVYTEISNVVSTVSIPLALLSYERMLNEPKQTVHCLVDWLKIESTASQIETAIAFISKPGYRPTSSSSHSGRFSESEIQIDRIASQDKRYSIYANDLSARIQALAADTKVAQRMLGEMRSRLRTLIASYKVNTANLGNISDLQRLPDVDLDTFYDILGVKRPLLKFDTEIPSPAPVVSNQLVELEKQAAMSRNNYTDIRARYLAAQNQRLLYQTALDECEEKIDVLSNLSGNRL